MAFFGSTLHGIILNGPSLVISFAIMKQWNDSVGFFDALSLRKETRKVKQQTKALIAENSAKRKQIESLERQIVKLRKEKNSIKSKIVLHHLQ